MDWSKFTAILSDGQLLHQTCISAIVTFLLFLTGILPLAKCTTDHAIFFQNNQTAAGKNHSQPTVWSAVRPTPSNMLFMGYQHNYFSYPGGQQPVQPPYASGFGPLNPSTNFKPEPFANLKLESSYKTSKSASQNRKNHLMFAGFGNYGNNIMNDYDVAPSETNERASVDSTNSNKKFDTIYGLNTGTSYTPACVRSQLQTICLDDPFYPTDSIKDAITHHQVDFAKLYAEVAFQSADNLCDGLTRTEEEKYCNVFSQIHPISAANSWSSNMGYVADATSSFDSLRTRTQTTHTQATAESTNGRGYVCASVIHYARILRAKNHRGQWRIVVNIPGYTQTSRMEECTRPLQRCQYLSPKLNSACVQKWNFQRMLVWDKYNGFEMDIFRIPVACSCFIRPRNSNSVMNFFPSVNNMAPPVAAAESPPSPSLPAKAASIPSVVVQSAASNSLSVVTENPLLVNQQLHHNTIDQQQQQQQVLQLPYKPYGFAEMLPEASHIYPYWSLGNLLPYHEIRVGHGLHPAASLFVDSNDYYNAGYGRA
ncbi:uncharacterized protein LOC129593927 [Paramacrobiotus metropolitanus]|uniref:uncharacterized protein LOC129593927 n=1 Tax=Paramacrobiotus metropolitanus TaxID=2943436 RepID=UPI00244607C0|nr:uncharacterized protein LOC129593927 [Paramacrobiotus metropolitanus]